MRHQRRTVVASKEEVRNTHIVDLWHKVTSNIKLFGLVKMRLKSAHALSAHLAARQSSTVPFYSSKGSRLDAAELSHMSWLVESNGPADDTDGFWLFLFLLRIDLTKCILMLSC
jgi:hypothetical protein